MTNYIKQTLGGTQEYNANILNRSYGIFNFNAGTFNPNARLPLTLRTSSSDISMSSNIISLPKDQLFMSWCYLNTATIGGNGITLTGTDCTVYNGFIGFIVSGGTFSYLLSVIKTNPTGSPNVRFIQNIGRVTMSPLSMCRIQQI